MKRYVYKGINGKWTTSEDWGLHGNSATQHDTWREAFDAAFIMVRKVLTNS